MSHSAIFTIVRIDDKVLEYNDDDFEDFKEESLYARHDGYELRELINGADYVVSNEDAGNYWKTFDLLKSIDINPEIEIVDKDHGIFYFTKNPDYIRDVLLKRLDLAKDKIYSVADEGLCRYAAESILIPDFDNYWLDISDVNGDYQETMSLDRFLMGDGEDDLYAIGEIMDYHY